MTNRFEGRVAVVTAGGSGIGAATAKLFSREGAKVVLLDISGTRAEAVASEIEAAGGEVAWMKGDVAVPETVPAGIDLAMERFGALDIMFNNAGLAEPGPVEELTLESWNRVMSVTATSTFLGIKYSLPIMRRQGRGTIVNTGSIDGFLGERNMASYCAAKAAVVNLTRAAALEAAPDGIRVNCVCPGSVRTRAAQILAKGREDEYKKAIGGAHPLGRIAEAEEIANLVAFLASDDASFITGAVYTIDGGLTADCHLPSFNPSPAAA
ncbi:MAG: meso-butanediol dehydrogenase / (S,S)-butanediol dehydrogenase / diacetyl reductase [Chloroflexota bacterium]|nr:meso-butanediol dehydrogenase / (S,S)-butanediol dehydrogenase / diacetyl reductase [Chloroflexota bacterium]